MTRSPLEIASLQNAQVKRLVRLRERRHREQEGVILVEGERETARALAAGLRPEAVYLCGDFLGPEAGAHAWPLSPTLLARPAFEKVSAREHPDGVLAVFAAPQPTLPEPEADATVLVLHGLEKPGNVGAIIRTADAVGAHGVLVLGRGADPYGPNVIRASQGSVFRVPVVALPEEEARAWLMTRGFRVLACTPDAAAVYWDADLTGRVALLLGTEHAGLPGEWRAQEGVGIPMAGGPGGADSLNVATAAALVLYEGLRQRRGKV